MAQLRRCPVFSPDDQIGLEGGGTDFFRVTMVPQVGDAVGHAEPAVELAALHA